MESRWVASTAIMHINSIQADIGNCFDIAEL